MAAKLVVNTALETLDIQLDPRQEYVLGRSHEANVLVRDPQVSRRHCLISAGADGQWTLTDLGSGNGTFMGKTRVAEHLLRHGDVVRIGASTAEFRQEETARPAAASAPRRPEARAPQPAAEDIPVLRPATGDTPAPRAADPPPAAAPAMPRIAPPPKEESTTLGAAKLLLPPIGRPAPAAPAPALPTIGKPPAAGAPSPFAPAPQAVPWRRTAKKLSPAAFGIVILSFFLPFMHISRADERVASLSGFDQVFGKGQFGLSALVLLAILAAAAGLGLSFLRSERSALGPAIAALVGFGLLVVRLVSYGSLGGEGTTADVGAGILIAPMIFFATAAFNGFLFFTRHPAPNH